MRKERKTILGYTFEYEIKRININALRFYLKNPRLYSIRRELGDSEPSQEKIYQTLKKRPHVEVLTADIKRQGVLLDAPIVKDKTFEVLEGNSRLAACRNLCDKAIKDKDDKRLKQFSEIDCKTVPHDIPDRVVSVLLGQYHIKSKTRWNPFDTASYVRDRIKELMEDGIDFNDSVSSVIKETGLSSHKIEKMRKTVYMMEKHNEIDHKKYSHYEVVNAMPIAKNTIEEFPELENILVEIIKNKITIKPAERGEQEGKDETIKATKFRDTLRPVLKNNRAKKKLLEMHDLQVAHDFLVKSGSLSRIVKELERFNNFLIENKEEIISVKKSEELGKMKFLFKRIRSNVYTIADTVIKAKDI